MPVDASAVEAMIRSLGALDTFGTKKEIRELPKILTPGETIRGLGSGMMDGNTWLITVTDRRIILLDKGLVYGLKQLDIPIHKIKSVTHKTGLMFGALLIDSGAQIKTMDNMRKADAPRLAGLITEIMHEGHQPTPTAQQVPNGDGTLDKLERLAALKEKGLLTDEEFAAGKQKILAGG
jgi:hypothetical protein